MWHLLLLGFRIVGRGRLPHSMQMHHIQGLRMSQLHLAPFFESCGFVRFQGFTVHLGTVRGFQVDEVHPAVPMVYDGSMCPRDASIVHGHFHCRCVSSQHDVRLPFQVDARLHTSRRVPHVQGKVRLRSRFPVGTVERRHVAFQGQAARLLRARQGHTLANATTCFAPHLPLRCSRVSNLRMQSKTHITVAPASKVAVVQDWVA
mmetsp:Transcript_7484/g.45978  ORF Transcript_7484/g.45978 Transcript_7484/m.45978 type:complete len:204 (-) Transcript_7484:2502-3113(-)